MLSIRSTMALIPLLGLLCQPGCQMASPRTSGVPSAALHTERRPEATPAIVRVVLQTPRAVTAEQTVAAEETGYAMLEPSLRMTAQQDLCAFLPRLRADAGPLLNRHTAVALGTALGASLLVRETLDDPVRNNTQRHAERWNQTSEALGLLGDVQVQVPVMLGLYSYSVQSQDEELYRFSKTLFSAYTVTGLSTLTVKAIANTDRPSDAWNGGQFGFPSFHAASATCIAAVADEYYGPRIGIPAYALAGLVSWTRIDQRDHDLSDVVFGTALGYVLGKSVARLERFDRPNLRLRSLVDANNGTHGVALEVAY